MQDRGTEGVARQGLLWGGQAGLCVAREAREWQVGTVCPCRHGDALDLLSLSWGATEPCPPDDPHVCSRKGEILASRKDFRMNTCTPHTSGAFMLELAGLSPVCLQDRNHEENNAGGAVGTVLG